jgi:peptide/nickel transport system substrate-binding protein
MPAETTKSRREFLKKASAATSAAGVTMLAGCGGDGSQGDGGGAQPAGEKVPELTYLQNPQSYSPPRYDAINLIAERLGQLGIDVNIQTMEFGALYNATNQEHDYDYVTWWTGFDPDPGIFLSKHFDSDKTGPGEGNYTGYENSEVDELLRTQFQLTEKSERVDQIHQIQELIMDDVPTMAVADMPDILAYNKNQIGNVTHRRGLAGFNSFWSKYNVEAKNDANEYVGIWGTSLETLNRMFKGVDKVLYHTVLLYHKLTQLNGDFEPEAEISLATDWTRVDGETFEFTIRDGQQFHDGEPLTVEDVAFSYNYIVERDAPAMSTQVGYLADQPAEVIADNKVRIQLNQTVGPAHQLVFSKVPIIPQHMWEDRENPAQANVGEPVGSGPMQVDYWDRGSELALKQFEPHHVDFNIDRHITRVITQSSTQYELLREGDIHAAGGISRELTELEEEPNVEVAAEPSTSFWMFSQNLRTEALQNKTLRKAAVNALPRKQIIEQILFGYPEVGTSVVARGYGDFHNPDAGDYEQGLDVARQRLEEAGFEYDNNEKLHFPESE